MKKIQRIQILLEILDRWGKLDKKSIDHHFSTKTGEELTDGLKRAIYRDLDELVVSNRIQIEYFYRDNTPIPEYDSNKHKNVICQWGLIGAADKIVGQDLFDKLNTQIYVPKLIKNGVSVSQGFKATKDKSISLYFVIAGEFLALNINREEIPVKIHISRNINVINKKFIENFEKKFGFRSIALLIPNSRVSSVDFNMKKDGHILIEINEDEILLKDLKSSNGTSYSQLTDAITKQIIEDGALLGHFTLKGNWADIPSNIVPKELIDDISIKGSNLLLNLGNDFLIIIK